MKRRWIWILTVICLLALSACKVTPIEEQVSEVQAEPAQANESETNVAPPVAEPAKAGYAADYHEVFEKLSQARGGMYSNAGGMYFEEDAVAEAAEEEEAVAEDDVKGLDYAETNVQVEGVDEGDIVKTDGQYIYVVHNYETLRIFRADGAEVAETASIPLHEKESEYWEWPSEMYIEGDRLAIVGTSSRLYYIMNEKEVSPPRDTVSVRIFDISDRSAPKEIKSVEQDGYFTNTRRIGNCLYVISGFGIWSAIEEDEPQTFVPCYYEDGEARMIAADRIFCPADVPDASYTVIGIYDLETGAVLDCQSVIGSPGTIYMNDSGLYLADSRYQDNVTDTYEEEIYKVEVHESGPATTVRHFTRDEEGLLHFAGEGEVPGSIYGQFALDEADGYLRIVTTGMRDSFKVYIDEKRGFYNYEYPDVEEDAGGTTNALYVLNESMETVGSLTGLAPGERVYSVRYSGDIAYFCTFRQVDPLFAVDVSDPEHPTEQSALKIPGFSEYLHVYGEGRLFGLGQEADQETGWTEGLKLTMFDTSDPTDVAVLHTERLDGSYSSAEYNHKAILVDPERDLIGFCADSTYVIYGYSDDEGFYRQAEIPVQDYGDARGLYIGGYYYIISDSVITVIDLEAFANVNEVSME